MSFTYGFFNSLNHDRVYDANAVSRLFDGMIVDGVYSTIGDCFRVTASEGLRVNVGSGRAWFNHTWSYNDTLYPVTAEEAEVVLDRIDALVLEINTTVAERCNSIKFVKGTPSSSPVKPTLTKSNGVYQYPFAYVYIRAGATVITQSNIENTIGTSECPFATALLEHVSIDTLLTQWSAEWQEWSNVQRAQFLAWMASEEDAFALWMSSEQSAYTTWSNAQKTAFNAWMAGEKSDFDDWFANLQYILDGDVAAHLQNEIDEINAEGLLGSVISIDTLDSTLFERRVDIIGPNETKHTNFDDAGHAVIRAFEDIGTCTVSASNAGGTIATAELNIPSYSKYHVDLAFFAATINVHTPSDVLYGTNVTVKKNGTTVDTIVFDASGDAQYVAESPGTYSFTVVYNEEEYTESVEVILPTTYAVSISVFTATVNITTPNNQLYNKPIAVTKNGVAVTSTTFSAQGTAQVILHEAGTYTFTVTY